MRKRISKVVLIVAILAILLALPAAFYIVNRNKIDCINKNGIWLTDGNESSCLIPPKGMFK